MAKLNLKKILPLLEAGKDFSLTERQYKKDTGQNLPKNPGYLKNQSAFARAAKSYGYVIEISERTVCLKKNK